MLCNIKPLLNNKCPLFVHPCYFPLKTPMVRTKSTYNAQITCGSESESGSGSGSGSESKSRSSSVPPPNKRNPMEGRISLEEWQRWGTNSPVPAMVIDAIAYLKSLENDTDALMNFTGNGGRLKGEFKVQEDKKHRATYQALDGSDVKFQFYSARQIACRVLGSRGYLCQNCWLPLEDCMCSKVRPCPLWRGIRFWLYMHPKDFLRQNNTGKLLWQVFGVQAATLCLFGVTEHEDIMWNEFRKAGSNKVWCLYPNKSGAPKSVKDYFSRDAPAPGHSASKMISHDDILNFILIDGTWSNSGAMFKRLKTQRPQLLLYWLVIAIVPYTTKDRAKLVWGEDDVACMSLTSGASAMHKLRPQPSWDRTCTAAAAASLLAELQQLPQFSPYCLDKQGEILEDALNELLGALTARRLRMGRSITRKMRMNTQIS